MSRNENVKCLESKNKNNLKGGSIYKDVEINDKYLDEILHNNNLKMDLAMQIISIDKTLGSNTVQNLKYFNSQPPATKAKTRTTSLFEACY